MKKFLSAAFALVFLSCGEEGTTSPNTNGGGNTVTGTTFEEALTNKQDCQISADQSSLACLEKDYKLVKIGNLLWFAENLNVGTSKQGKYCYDDKPSNCDVYGGLYNWTTAMALPDTCKVKECSDITSYPNHQGICPNGWHISNSDDFDDLALALGGDSIAGKAMKANSSDWPDWNKSEANDGNSSGFSALPALYRFEDGSYGNTIAVTTFWLPLEIWDERAFGIELHQSSADLMTAYSAKGKAYSIRCVKDP